MGRQWGWVGRGRDSPPALAPVARSAGTTHVIYFLVRGGPYSALTRPARGGWVSRGGGGRGGNKEARAGSRKEKEERTRGQEHEEVEGIGWGRRSLNLLGSRENSDICIRRAKGKCSEGDSTLRAAVGRSWLGRPAVLDTPAAPG